MTTATLPAIKSVKLMVGLEVHVELATLSKMFSRAKSPAHPDAGDPEPNSLIDPVVLGLPGALPVMNKAAVEMSMRVGLALNCSIAKFTKWDRKSYFYPDLPKAYQISQYDLPLCFDGAVDLPAMDENGFLVGTDETSFQRIGIIRAHLEEDSGKLLHEAPGGAAIDGSIVDLNRAGTPLLEIVTQPDFSDADSVVAFARTLRNICRFLRVTEGIMQRGHMRFEPNINTIITLDDGTVVKTPIVEIKNLNSFRALKRSIEFEFDDQPKRWQNDGRVMGAGMKQTRGWDDINNRTTIQREKEDAHDYRYFPDPDLPPVVVSEAWIDRIRQSLPELPISRVRRYAEHFGFAVKEASALADEPETNTFFERTIKEIVNLGIDATRAGRQAGNFILQAGMKRANERQCAVEQLGISPEQIAGIVRLREDGKISSNSADELFGVLCDPANVGADPEQLATSHNMLIVRDEGALIKWCQQAIDENAPIVDQIKSGKVAAVGRLVGNVMKLSGGSADAKAVREKLLEMMGVKE